ncbi:ABC transporter permease [Ohtaekwangia koreensis]|uniref:Duplicated orphan permease n=1 Tax=Ohtaekwangia koreensis TaxID=688867 RepID=A0A1T5L736_9BACT|nr:ABC transporter permease [Ohtaekwangia koreensis]SKC71837.1 duplicated orphan permease [Ohtaekwangia koreensis]
MLKNYFKTAFRNLLRSKGISIINLSGLTLGIACSLVLFLMVAYMSSYDIFQSKRDRIYRVVNKSVGNNGTEYQAGVPTVLPEAFRTDFPEAEEVVFISEGSSSLVTIPQKNGELKKFQEENKIAFTEPGYFKIFDRAILSGDAIKGIDEPNEAIISTQLAKKYFGKEDAIGEVLKFNDQEYRVTAMMENAPPNTDFPFNLFLSYSTIKKEREEAGWKSIWSGEQCYILLKEREQIAKIEQRLPAFSKKYLGADDPDKTEFMVQPLTEMHFDERFDTYSYSTVSRTSLTAFSIIGLILILTACINFVNLSTAEAIKRSKEVGVRKSLGSTRMQLVGQFLGETTLVTTLAMLLSLGLTQLALAFINPFMEMELALNFTSDTSLWLFIICVTVIVSLMSGLYPAFVVSGFKPAQALKNLISNKNSSGYMLRRGLVVMQFFISQLLIIGTIVIVSQMNYYQDKDLGFAKDGILIVPIPEQEQPAGIEEGGSKMRTLRDEMENIPGVEMASLANDPPSSGHVSGTNFKLQGSDESHGTQVKQIDGNYLKLFELELLTGQNVQDLDTATGFIVNEKLAHIAGFDNAADIVGKVIRVWSKEYPVVGVVKDFHTVSLHSPIEATVLFNRIRGYEHLALKVNVKQAQGVISQLKTKWEAAYPEHLFEYEFLDENIRNFYEGEQRMSILLSIFTSMAIFIGCLGLFGLATFMANQKTKEIGVRKVLGASVESIVMMFSKEYAKLILLGFMLAAPAGWFLMGKFLDEFAYKIEVGPQVFVLTFGITLLIAILTVGYKSLRAATVNPVNSLRSE